MPHESKGSSSCFVFKHIRRRHSYMYLIILVLFNGPSSRKTPEDPANTTQRSGLLAAAQPMKRGEELRLSLVLVFKNVLFSPYEVLEAAPCSNFNPSYNLMRSCCFFLCTWYEKKKIWIRLKCLLVSTISRTMPTQKSALCLFSDCHTLFVSLGNASTQIHTDSHGLLCEGEGRMQGGSWWMREFSFLLWCTAKCWVHVKAKPTVSFKSQ